MARVYLRKHQTNKFKANQYLRDDDWNGDSRQKLRTASFRLPMPITSTNSESLQKSPPPPPQFASLSASPQRFDGEFFAAMIRRRGFQRPKFNRRLKFERWKEQLLLMKKRVGLLEVEQGQEKTLVHERKLVKTGSSMEVTAANTHVEGFEPWGLQEDILRNVALLLFPGSACLNFNMHLDLVS